MYEQLNPVSASKRTPKATIGVQRAKGDIRRRDLRPQASVPAIKAIIPTPIHQNPGGGPGGWRRRPLRAVVNCEVVVTVRVEVEGVAPFNGIPGGNQVQVALAGTDTVQLRRTTWLKPLSGVSVAVYVAVWPALIESRAGVAAIEKSWRKIESVTVVLNPPLAPCTVKLVGLAVAADRLLTVKVLVWPA